MSSFSESSTSAQTKKSFLGLSQDMTVLIGGVGGAFLVIIIAIIGICCIVRKIHKNSSPPNTPAHSRPTSQQEPAEMTSVRQKLYLSLTVMLSIQWSRVFFNGTCLFLYLEVCISLQSATLSPGAILPPPETRGWFL